jgi:hypothetical protein
MLVKPSKRREETELVLLIAITMVTKKTSKKVGKHARKAVPAKPNPKYVVETVTSSNTSVVEEKTDNDPIPEVPEALTTKKNAPRDRVGGDVVGGHNPQLRRTTTETAAGRRLNTPEGLMEPDDAAPNLSGGNAESETAVAPILGSGSGPFGAKPVVKDYSNDHLASGNPYAYDASSPHDDYGQEKSQPVTSTGGFSSYNEYGSVFQRGVGIYKLVMKATTSPASSGDGSVYCVNNYLQTDRARMDTAGMAAQNGTGIFSKAFAGQWTIKMVDPEPEEG